MSEHVTTPIPATVPTAKLRGGLRLIDVRKHPEAVREIERELREREKRAA